MKSLLHFVVVVVGVLLGGFGGAFAGISIALSSYRTAPNESSAGPMGLAFAVGLPLGGLIGLVAGGAACHFLFLYMNRYLSRRQRQTNEEVPPLASPD